MHKKREVEANFITGVGSRREKKYNERSLFNGRERGKEEKKVGSGRTESSAKRTNGDGGQACFKRRRSIKSLIKGLRNQISFTR